MREFIAPEKNKSGHDIVGLMSFSLTTLLPFFLPLLSNSDDYGFTLFKAMEKEMGGDAGKGALFALGMKLKPYDTVAKLIHDACKGFGTNELLLTTALIRYQALLKPVADAYNEEYGKDLQEVVRSETGGDYRKLLLKVVETGYEL